MALYLSQKERLVAKTQAYLYKWTHIPTQKWYVGSRTAAGCHINVLFVNGVKTIRTDGLLSIRKQ